MRLLAFVVVLAAAGKPWMGFAPYPGARELCTEHVSGTTMHILWRSFAVADDMATVVAFYEKDAGAKAKRGDGGEASFALDPAHSLTIYPSEKNDAFPSCARKPHRGERTVIQISTAVGRRR